MAERIMLPGDELTELRLSNGLIVKVNCGAEWCGRCEFMGQGVLLEPLCSLFSKRLHYANPGHRFGVVRTERCREAERLATRKAGPK